ncbi:hypothetical protein GQ55_1G053900 [Panicum hallii var. hallii]|uniref:PUM-HD domain-containing protein n=1 Tax=Panicum hallii var. hallii TaxID=1504633 RepID=A0A2T7F2J0_9POAL|nr:hypothetical protein GQ55_1G053900 [Panicum hallii var. hallii]
MFASSTWCPPYPQQSMAPSSTTYWILGLQHPCMASSSAQGPWWAPPSSTHIEDSELQVWFGGPPDNDHAYVQLLQQKMGTPVHTASLRLKHIRGQVVAFCANAKGSRFIQRAVDGATTEEIIMVYKEIMPYVRTLAVDMFGNHAVQKILNHGPRSYKRIFIRHLMGDVLGLSLHMYGCRVIQKAFEVAEHDQKLVMAMELGRKVLRCVRDQYANYVIQKCIECVPSKHIQFIFRSLYGVGKAKMLSTHPYGCHVVQKVLAYCNPEIHHAMTAEIIESVQMLSADRFGNYVVQHLLEHGGVARRSTMVEKFATQIVAMSYHKYASNVIEKCLTFGCHHDRQLITSEIIAAGGGQHLDDHFMDMMIDPYASSVIQKMVVTAEERQVRVLVGVARSNAAKLMRYTHGRRVIAAIERFLAARGTHAMPCPGYRC